MKMTFAQVEFHPTRQETVRILGDYYQLHQFVYRLFQNERSTNRILYRLETQSFARAGRPRLIVQISGEDDDSDGMLVSHASEHYADITVRTIDVFLRKIPYRFRARVNPVKSVPSPIHGTRGKRVGIEGSEDQIAWFQRQVANRGMQVDSVDLLREPWIRIRKPGKPNYPLTFLSVVFEGTLRIIDTEKAHQGLAEGIGPGKGFGFGLLSLAGTGREV